MANERDATASHEATLLTDEEITAAWNEAVPESKDKGIGMYLHLTRAIAVAQHRKSSQSASAPLSPPEMTRLMAAAGYDTEKTHPACYDRFSYFALFQLLANGLQSATEAIELLREARRLFFNDALKNYDGYVDGEQDRLLARIDALLDSTSTRSDS